MADQQKSKAWPIANATLTNQVRCFAWNLLSRLTRLVQILDLVQQASQYKQLKKGANEGMSCSFPPC